MKQSQIDWTEFALNQGFGICNVCKNLGIHYGNIEPKRVSPSWVLIVPSGDKDADRKSLIQAFEHFEVGK